MAVLPTGIGPVTGYNIERSLRFNSADSAYLNRTPASAGNRKTWTWSGWVKLSKTSFNNFLECVGPTTPGTRTSFMMQDLDKLDFFTDNTTSSRLTTTQIFRDFSAWYHIVLAVDTTQATASNRVKIYVNGSQITAFSTANYPSQNLDTQINNTQLHTIGRVYDPFYANMYLTEVNFIDGSAKTPSDFGETDANTGVWKPKAYTGTYGTNGFYLKFADNSGTTSTTLGKDSSGNGNNWTPNNFSVTAGVGNDSLVDSPTSYGTDTGVGGTVRGNYCTLNPLNKSGGMTLSDGNLRQSMDSATGYSARGTIAASSGKWYAEAFVQNKTTQTVIGVCDVTMGANQDPISAPVNAVGYYANAGTKYVNGTSSAYGATYTTNDIIGIALDMDALTVTFYKNNTSQGSIALGTTGLNYTFFASDENYLNTQIQWNFGQRPFAYTAPSGFKALCTQNLPTPTIGATSTTQANDYFDATTYTGDGANPQNIVNSAGMAPDLVWTKSRSTAVDNFLADTLRGAANILRSNLTSAEAVGTGGIQTLNTNGFGVNGNQNTNGTTYVGWQWKANGAGSSNTAGTITSTVSANTTSGFSIVTYTGNGSAGATIGHGLGVAPSMIIVKQRTAIPSAQNWIVGHTSMGWGSWMWLDLTNGQQTNSVVWNNTAPTSSVFSVGTGNGVNVSTGTYVAYCFSAVSGYSAFGKYTGNGSTDGPFVYTGFRPKYLLLKLTNTTGSWQVKDSARNTYNVTDLTLYPNLSNAEASDIQVDFLSNGFKLRSSTGENANGNTVIYAAFAESPFKYSLAR